MRTYRWCDQGKMNCLTEMYGQYAEATSDGKTERGEDRPHTPCCTPACVLGRDYVLASPASDVSSQRTPVY